ncbi:unnamed protein product, partial [Tetraodon nigroviridis]
EIPCSYEQGAIISVPSSKRLKTALAAPSSPLKYKRYISTAHTALLGIPAFCSTRRNIYTKATTLAYIFR